MLKRTLLALSLSVALTGCGLDPQLIPSLTGPSELAESISFAASPDVLLQDGTSQSTLTVTVTNFLNQPIAGRQFVITARFGTTPVNSLLSANSATTNAQGKASVVLTAPALGSGTANSVTVDLIPVGTDANNTLTRGLSIRIVR